MKGKYIKKILIIASHYNNDFLEVNVQGHTFFLYRISKLSNLIVFMVNCNIFLDKNSITILCDCNDSLLPNIPRTIFNDDDIHYNHVKEIFNEQIKNDNLIPIKLFLVSEFNDIFQEIQNLIKKYVIDLHIDIDQLIPTKNETYSVMLNNYMLNLGLQDAISLFISD